MNASWRWGATSLVASLLFLPAIAFALDTDSFRPQIARLAYVEGDVRVSKGDGNGVVGKSWMQAQQGVPIEQGFNVATQVGKAEIELEDGSTVYLADHSTLVFEELLDFNGAPQTLVELMSGTVTVDVHPPPQAAFALQTPAGNRILVRSPDTAWLRVDSYLDGMAITPQRDTTTTSVGAEKVQLYAGQSRLRRNGIPHRRGYRQARASR